MIPLRVFRGPNFRTKARYDRFSHASWSYLYFVLEGEVRFWVGEEEFEAAPGTLVYLPRDVPHALAVENPGVARLLLQWFPSNRLEEYFVKLGEEAKAPILPPPPGQLDTKKMAAALEKFGIEVLGPPPSLSR
jgi:Cupin domain